MTTFQESIKASALTKTMPYAVIFHSLLIFGVGFGIHASTKTKNATVLDITIVNTQSDDAPDEADLIAQVNQLASGSTDEKNRPRDLMSSKNINALDGIAPLASTQTVLNTPPVLKPLILTTKGETFKRSPKLDEQPDKKTQKESSEVAEETLEEARLVSEVAVEEADYSKMPRVLHLNSTNTKGTIEASYIDQWAKKIERIGTTNFPQEAIRLQQSGRLIVIATLNKKGQIVNTNVHKSSGSRLLDNAALRIIKIASPYSAFPQEIRESFDQLEITRTFIFDTGYKGLRTE